MGNMGNSFIFPLPTTTKTYDHVGDTQVSLRSLYSDPLVSNGEGERVGIRVDAGHGAVGTYVKKVSMLLKKHGTVTGSYFFKIRNSSDVVHGTATGDATALTDLYVVTELTLDNYVLIQAGDRVTIEYNNTARTTDGLDIGTSTANWEANTTQQLYSTGGGWVNDPDGAVGRKYQMTFDSTPV